jgi:midasin
MRKILRALELDRSIIMEGQPGVGKTSLIEKLAHLLGKTFYRVNLSEQTDLIDLLGSDVPVGNSSLFEWADGLLLRAMKEGAWFMLDELNLASQSVLEGLNSILDHRGSIYISELDKVVTKHPNFRLFGSQNPMTMGAGRKGLPHSFLSRFSRIWLEVLPDKSLKGIIGGLYGLYGEDKTGRANLEKRMLVEFFFEVKKVIESKCGVVWEFNLRDLHRIFEYLMVKEQSLSSETNFDEIFSKEIDYICDIIVFKR